MKRKPFRRLGVVCVVLAFTAGADAPGAERRGTPARGSSGGTQRLARTTNHSQPTVRHIVRQTPTPTHTVSNPRPTVRTTPVTPRIITPTRRETPPTVRHVDRQMPPRTDSNRHPTVPRPPIHREPITPTRHETQPTVIHRTVQHRTTYIRREHYSPCPPVRIGTFPIFPMYSSPTVVVTDYSPDYIVRPTIVPVRAPVEYYEPTPIWAPATESPASAVVEPALTGLPPGEPGTYLEQGEAAFAAGRYDEARRLFRRAVMQLPDDAYAQLDYGLVHFALGEYSAAAEAFRRALSADPDLLDRLPDVSTAYGARESFEMHLGALARFLESNPTHTDARFVLGLVLFSVGDAQSAIAELSRVLHRNPRDTAAYLLRDAALRAVEGAPAIGPNSVED